MSVVSNVKIYGLEDSIKASKYPMAVDISKLDSELTKTAVKLAQCEKGTGHDNWLNGVIVQFDLTLTNKAWVEAERYHFLDFVSSQSTMHKITKFDLDKSYIEYVDPRMIEIMKEKVNTYNEDPTPENYLRVLYSNPCGFRLTARMTTNYRQLKTIYAQRLTHRLPEWREVCSWIETLPEAELITKSNKTAEININLPAEEVMKKATDILESLGLITHNQACEMLGLEPVGMPEFLKKKFNVPKYDVCPACGGAGLVCWEPESTKVSICHVCHGEKVVRVNPEVEE